MMSGGVECIAFGTHVFRKYCHRSIFGSWGKGMKLHNAADAETIPFHIPDRISTDVH